MDFCSISLAVFGSFVGRRLPSFDKMCQDMLAMADDMSGDVYPHGAREVVSHELTANNQANRKK